MTIAQFIVTYAVCWWLVLFMVLPSGVTVAANPERGHAPSAPEKPRLGRKFRITTLLAIIPAIVIYFVAVAAKADDTIYQVGSDCEPLETHRASDDVAAKDGYGAGGKKVKSATLQNDSVLGDMSSINIPLVIPVDPYLDPNSMNVGRNVDLSQGFADIGTLTVSDGQRVLLNDQPIGEQQLFSKECESKRDRRP